SPNLEFMKPFGCPVTILNTLDHLGKFNGKADEGFLVGYSVNSKAFRVFNSRTRKVKENMHVNFLENKPNVAESIQTDIHVWQASQEKAVAHEYILLPFISSNPPLSLTIHSSDVNAGDQLGDVNAGDIQSDVQEISRNDDVCQGNEIRIDSSTHAVNAASISINTASNIIYAGSLNINTADSNHTNISTLRATGIFDGAFDDRDLGAEADTNNLDSSIVALKDPSWIEAMQEELLQFKLQDVWTLVNLPYGKRAIGLKWVFKNKLDEKVARIEAIRLFLAYASFKDYIVYQMDVKSAFLYGTIEEEVYVCQPLRFKDPDFPNKVYKVKKALYGLHQAPIACQDKYVAESLNKFGFFEVKTRSTPMKTSNPLLKDKDGQEVDVYIYRSMVGSLMYLTSLRPDIMFDVCECARH
nr:hypothetical protein [Tanacetum cinerariifolium]